MSDIFEHTHCLVCNQPYNTKNPNCGLCKSVNVLLKDCVDEFPDHCQVDQFDIDTKEQLLLFHHIVGINDRLTKASKNIRGLILDKNGQSVCPSLPLVEEYNVKNVTDPRGSVTDPKGSVIGDQKEKLTDEMVEKSTIYYDKEGAIIRVYYCNDSWHMSTNKRINAYNSKWGSDYSKTAYNDVSNIVSFGDLFDLAISVAQEGRPTKPSFYESLDKEFVYAFLVRNDKYSMNISPPPSEKEEKMYLIGKFTKTGQKVEMESNSLISKMPILEGKNKPTTVSQLIEKVSSLSLDYPGLILDLGGDRYVKIFNPKYEECLSIRHGDPNLLRVYLKLRYENIAHASTETQKRMKLFKDLYKLIFNTELIEKTINQIYQQIIEITKIRKTQKYICSPHFHYAWKTLQEHAGPINVHICHNVLDTRPELIFNLIASFTSSISTISTDSTNDLANELSTLQITV